MKKIIFFLLACAFTVSARAQPTIADTTHFNFSDISQKDYPAGTLLDTLQLSRTEHKQALGYLTALELQIFNNHPDIVLDTLRTYLVPTISTDNEPKAVSLVYCNNQRDGGKYWYLFDGVRDEDIKKGFTVLLFKL